MEAFYFTICAFKLVIYIFKSLLCFCKSLVDFFIQFRKFSFCNHVVLYGDNNLNKVIYIPLMIISFLLFHAT